MYSGQRFQALPRDPVSLQSSLVQTCKQTCTKGHTLPSKHYRLRGEQRNPWTSRASHTGRAMMCISVCVCVCVCVSVNSLAYFNFPFFLCSFNGTLTIPEHKGEAWQYSCYPSPLQSCINNYHRPPTQLQPISSSLCTFGPSIFFPPCFASLSIMGYQIF